ncbi:MAG: hypothetical protein ACJ8H8_03650, partial [Geminicoccaceae bacterium]
MPSSQTELADTGQPGTSTALDPRGAGGTARRLLLTAFQHSPFWIDPPYKAALHYALPLVRRRHPLRRLTGIARDGQSAAVLVAGDTSSLDVEELAQAFFTAPPEDELIGSLAGPALALQLADMLDTHDLVLARTWRVFARDAAAAGLLAVPHVPELRLPVGTAESMLAGTNQSIRRMVRRCDEEGYRLEISAGNGRFAEFYHDFHQPFVRQRHGINTVEHEPQAMRRRLRRGGISWTVLNGERLFAVAFEIVDGTFRELFAGSPAGRVDLAVQRARCASRAGHIHWCAERGLRWLVMGGCRPWLSDGMLANKRAWGGELVPRSDDLRSLLVGWRRWRPALAQLLADYPLVVRAPDGFGAITAAPDDCTPPSDWQGRAPRGLRHLHVVAGSGVISVGLVDGVPHRTTAFGEEVSSANLVAIIGAAAMSG